jgi:hypothetical protein
MRPGVHVHDCLLHFVDAHGTCERQYESVSLPYPKTRSGFLVPVRHYEFVPLLIEQLPSIGELRGQPRILSWRATVSRTLPATDFESPRSKVNYLPERHHVTGWIPSGRMQSSPKGSPRAAGEHSA